MHLIQLFGILRAYLFMGDTERPNICFDCIMFHSVLWYGCTDLDFNKRPGLPSRLVL